MTIRNSLTRVVFCIVKIMYLIETWTRRSYYIFLIIKFYLFKRCFIKPHNIVVIIDIIFIKFLVIFYIKKWQEIWLEIQKNYDGKESRRIFWENFVSFSIFSFPFNQKISILYVHIKVLIYNCYWIIQLRIVNVKKKFFDFIFIKFVIIFSIELFLLDMKHPNLVYILFSNDEIFWHIL